MSYENYFKVDSYNDNLDKEILDELKELVDEENLDKEILDELKELESETKFSIDLEKALNEFLY